MRLNAPKSVYCAPTVVHEHLARPQTIRPFGIAAFHTLKMLLIWSLTTGT